ncbi:Transcription factor TRY [Linum perenne]
MDEVRRRRNRTNDRKKPAAVACSDDQDEVSSKEWTVIEMSEAEEDLIHRMHRLVGDRWDLIAGRIPGRKPEEIERFWIMKKYAQS